MLRVQRLTSFEFRQASVRQLFFPYVCTLKLENHLGGAAFYSILDSLMFYCTKSWIA